MILSNKNIYYHDNIFLKLNNLLSYVDKYKTIICTCFFNYLSKTNYLYYYIYLLNYFYSA